MISWKTTLCGVLAIIGGGLTQFFNDVPLLLKIGGLLATTAPAIGLLFARDNNVTSEQAGAGKDSGNPPPTDAKPTARPGHALETLILCAALGAGVLALAGCASQPRAIAYQTLADLRAVVDRAEKVYAREAVAGRISARDQQKVDAQIVQFHAAFLASVRAARADYSTPASPDLDRLAESLVALIYTFAKEPGSLTMDPITAALAAQGLLALLEIYRQHTGKPKDWVPTGADWDELEAWAKRTPEQIKAEARSR